MKKNIRVLLSISIMCMTLTLSSFSSAETVEMPIERNDSAQIYEGQVRINTLEFNNTEVKEPILLYQGSYYLPMTPKVLSNLGITSSMSDGLLTFGLDVPNITGEKQSLPTIINESNRVSVVVYQKKMTVSSIVIDPEIAYLPTIVYNNTFYVPLSSAMINEGLKIELYFNKDQTLMIHRMIDDMPRGTIVNYPETKQKDYLVEMESSLIALKDTVVSSGIKYESDGQVEYFLEEENKESSYVEFDGGDWLITSSIKGETGRIYYYYADTEYHYVGEYNDGSFKGIGRYFDKNDNVTVIKPYEREVIEVAYTEKKITLEGYTPVLGVLIEFSDITIKGSEEQWYQKLFGDDPNSLRGYYDEITGNTYKLIPAVENSGILNDGLIKIKLDIPHPNTKTVDGVNDLIELIAEQIEDNIDLNLYDTNDNGIIDSQELAIISILAGYESSPSTPDKYPQFRPHHLESDISLAVIDKIGVMHMIYIGELEYFSETAAFVNGGVIAHEFGHQLGLPDLYDTDNSSKGLGPFSLMAGGSNNYGNGERPGEVISYMDPWSYIHLNIIEAEVVKISGEYQLNSALTGNYNIIRVNTPNPNEYFLLENREIKGRDLSLKKSTKQSGGILIYHIDESIINEKETTRDINDDEQKKGIDIEESSERNTGSVLDNDDYRVRYAPFFSAKGISLFDNKSKPLNRLNDGTDSGVIIEILTDGPSSKVKISIE